MTARSREPGSPVDPSTWQDELLSFARKMGAASDVEDIVQEALLRSMQRPAATSPRAYLYRTVLNLLADRGRARGRDAKVMAAAAEARSSRIADDPAKTAETRDLAAAAWDAADALPDQQRAALILRVRSGMDYGEIGMVLGTTAATARQHFYLAARSVRTAMSRTSNDARHGGTSR